eukprot:gnl/TRDRNA2_/TRDRNA2_166704_c1_seq2.p1 gnl/TRDRNA2_/TRDRNA2_166704_c1~~gnl/TRDRNA2_/TRDRNA2_166704_c1_seq2.p1  ORF type:complete len:296 (+),score=49.52 gnl/TRDRNA2_/TRDRNA2_166704_c1_seq2:269-1156(+)
MRPLGRLCGLFRQHIRDNRAVAQKLTQAQKTRWLAESLCGFLSSKGFRGCGRSKEEFYRVQNSVMDKVLERRRGVPVALALIYMEVGQAAGLELRGQNFPGYFLLAFGQGKEAGLLDASENRVIDEQEAAQILGSFVVSKEGRKGLDDEDIPDDFDFDDSGPLMVEIGDSWRQERLPKVEFLYRMVGNLDYVWARVLGKNFTPGENEFAPRWSHPLFACGRIAACMQAVDLKCQELMFEIEDEIEEIRKEVEEELGGESNSSNSSNYTTAAPREISSARVCHPALLFVMCEFAGA